MIDTIKISVENNFLIRDTSLFSVKYKVGDRWFYKTLKEELEYRREHNYGEDYPLKAYLKPLSDGVYRPKIEYVISPYTNPLLYLEFSAPKLLFGNNLYEIPVGEESKVISKLITVLKDLGIEVTRNTLKNALVRKIHYSKNFILDKKLKCSDVLNLFKETRYPHLRRFKDYKENKSVQARCKSFGISMYDKIADMEDSGNYNDNEKFNLIKGQYKNRILRVEIKFDKVDKTDKLQKIIKYPAKSKLILKDVFKSWYLGDVFKDTIDKICNHKEMPKIILEANKREELEKECKNVNELAKRMMLVSYQQEYGSYDKAIEKLREHFKVGKTLKDKYRTVITNNEQLKTIFNKLLEETEHYTCVQKPIRLYAVKHLKLFI
ncbi:MAG: hypothetical protein IKO48_01950 [Elusimicrobia bacterium]|nr:hypothetical protein [Elusimicrobiota bacterium]